jgi:hypothetical protein
MACTDSGRCCKGTSCTETKRCLCRCASGSVFTTGGTCATGTCVSGTTCTAGVTPCACTSGTFTAGGTCDCRSYPNVCDASQCYACNQSTGVCYDACPSYRDCCSGFCCAESEYCSTLYGCTKRCSTGQTYCRQSLSPYSYTCCGAGYDCCSGTCIARQANSYNLPSGTLAWTTTGYTLTASQYLTVTATGSLTWSHSGGTWVAGPDGNNDITLTKVLATAPTAAVLITTGGSTIKTGSSWSGTPGAGALSLRFNIASLDYGTLTGSFTVTVTVHGCDPGVAPQGETMVFTHAVPPAPSTDGGPGTELKGLLRYMGIVATPNCSCNARAEEMDRREQETPGWCAENMDTILGWLQEQAKARGLPFVRAAAKLLVNRAISLAKRKAARKGINQ